MTQSSHPSIEVDPVADFLYDVNVALDYAYAIPDRVIFPELAPRYAQYPELPLVARLLAAYDDLKREREGKRFLGIIQAALVRCSSFPMGTYRSLAVLDVARVLWPEHFSPNLARSLLFIQAERELPDWIGELASRWMNWPQKQVDLSLDQWVRAVATVEPRRLQTLVFWGFDQPAPHGLSPEKFVDFLFEEACARLSRGDDDVQKSRIDVVRCLHALNDAAIQRKSAFAANAETLLREQQEKALKKCLNVDGYCDPDEEDWSRHENDNFYGESRIAV